MHSKTTTRYVNAQHFHDIIKCGSEVRVNCTSNRALLGRLRASVAPAFPLDRWALRQALASGPSLGGLRASLLNEWRRERHFWAQETKHSVTQRKWWKTLLREASMWRKVTERMDRIWKLWIRLKEHLFCTYQIERDTVDREGDMRYSHRCLDNSWIYYRETVRWCEAANLWSWDKVIEEREN